MNLRINPTINRAQNLLLRYHLLIASLLVTLFFGLSFGAMLGDSAIVDELAHIPAAYSYVHFDDYRLNPEHPPLLKDLAGIPLQFLNLKFPVDSPNWTTTLNGQFGMGYDFIYHSGNDANKIIFWARLPLLLLATAFGFVFYAQIRRRFGTFVALISLFFYALSPNILAHSHYVTTDVGATIGMFVALAAIIRYFERPTRLSLLVLSGCLALAQLTKFSSIVLYPFMALVWLVIICFRLAPRPWILLRGIVIASVLSLFFVYLWYVPNTINMPAQMQSNLFYGSLYNGIGPAISSLCAPLSSNSFLKPILQYILGVIMVILRVNNGNVTYFNGVVENNGFHDYFPEIFILKTQIAFLILMFGLTVMTIMRIRKTSFDKARDYMKSHRYELVMLGFILYYFGIAVAGNLNLGIRHILPIYPPLFVLVALGCVRFIRQLRNSKAFLVVIVILLMWYGSSTIAAYPEYTSYFNGLIGGAANADKYFSDSGVDWGQDLYRFKDYVDSHPEIHSFALDYFGGGVPSYIFCKHVIGSDGRMLSGSAGLDCSKSNYTDWHSTNAEYTGQYIAVSETFLINDAYFSGLSHTQGYAYLRARQPIAKIGNSIYLYKLY